MNKETEASTHTTTPQDGEKPTDLLHDDQEQTQDDIVAFGHLLRDSYIPNTGLIPLILDSFATPQNPLGKIKLANAMHDIFPSWEFPSTSTSNLLGISRASGHNIAITKIGRNTWYYLDSIPENTGMPDLTYKSTTNKTDTLRQLIEEGVYSNSQIIDILFPDTPRNKQSINLKVHLTKLRNILKDEDAYIPDRRLFPEANLRILYNPPTLLKEETAMVLQSDVPSDPISDPVKEGAARVALPSDPRNVKQIPDVIEKRDALRRENNVPRLIRYKDPDTQLMYTQIETPNGKHTKPLNLTSDELNLFRTIFENSGVYSRVKLELAMVDISRSTAYESSGGFELVFNSLNQKILKDWKICITFNDEECAVLGSPDQHQNLTRVTQHTESDYSGRQPGNVRKRWARHS